MRALVAALAIVCTGSVSIPGRSTSGISVSSGRLVECAAGSDGLEVGIDTGSRVLRFALDRSEVAGGIPTAHASIVGDRYTIHGPCPAPGGRVAVTHCPDCASRPLYAIETSNDADAGEGLFVTRSFIDRLDLANADDERTALFVTSMILAKHNRADGRNRTLWLRDTLKRALDAYTSESRAQDMCARFGGRHLVSAIDQIVAIAAAHGDEPGLVRALPFIPPDPRAAPFVGSWGTFALEIYLEEQGHELTRLF